MAGYNRIIVVGNLTRDPEYKQLPSGQAVSRLGIASNRQYRNKQTGSMVQEVCFIDVDVFGAQAESCRQFLQKGRPVLVEGRLKFDTWQSPDGQARSKHSIVADRVVFLSAGPQAEGATFDSTNDDAVEAEPIAAVRAAIKQTKTAPRAKKTLQEDSAQQESVNTGELAFQDEPPFQDDLPF